MEARLTHTGLWGGRDSGLVAADWISGGGIQLAWKSIKTNMGAARKELLKLLSGALVAGGERG